MKTTVTNLSRCSDIISSDRVKGAYLSDPPYVHKRRIDDKSTEEFVEVFMKEMHKNFPNMIIQFEDFATSKASPFFTNIAMSILVSMTTFKER
ncbi:hypothetical protein JCM5353_008985 [Sporobolomyces roseus]